MDGHKNRSRSNLTFEDLPQAICDVLSRLEQIEMLLAPKSAEDGKQPPIDTKELCKFLNVTEPTITRYRRKGLIPYYTIGSAIRYDLSKVIAALENKKRQNA